MITADSSLNIMQEHLSPNVNSGHSRNAVCVSARPRLDSGQSNTPCARSSHRVLRNGYTSHIHGAIPAVPWIEYDVLGREVDEEVTA